jgi:hypothetical protein
MAFLAECAFKLWKKTNFGPKINPSTGNMCVVQLNKPDRDLMCILSALICHISITIERWASAACASGALPLKMSRRRSKVSRRQRRRQSLLCVSSPGERRRAKNKKGCSAEGVDKQMRGRRRVPPPTASRQTTHFLGHARRHMRHPTRFSSQIRPITQGAKCKTFCLISKLL